jgi:hypothetical protein
MRLEQTSPFWIVEDPGPDSELADICLQTSLAGLVVQFRGGWTAERRPTLFTSRARAEAEAKARMRLAVRAGLERQFGHPKA